MKSVILIYLLLFVCNLGIAQGNTIDLEKAEVYATEKKHLQALQILVPCLKDDIKMGNNSLEECLFLGGVIFKQAFSIENNHINEPLLAEFQKLGLDVNYWKWAPSIDNNNFFQKMNRLFPKGKYEDVLVFESITWAYNELAPILKTVKAFEKYRKDYPKGRDYAEATLNLAHIYDNLWEDIREPLADEGLHESYFSSGNPVRDAQGAERYRCSGLVKV